MALTAAPRIETERLILRGPEARDFDPIADFFADSDRSWGFGGPQNRNQAWLWFASLIGHWALKGFAYEAAMAARDHAYRRMGFTALSSNIFPGNARSVALSERMGAWKEREYDNVSHGTEMVYRHLDPEACV